jgi:hypothetical protein
VLTNPPENTYPTAAVDKRIKAVVTTSMYDMSRVMAKGYYHSRWRRYVPSAIQG